LVSGRWLERDDMVNDAMAALDWLAKEQTSRDGYFHPIGSERPYLRGQVKPLFDQQPVEAHGSISAYTRAWRVTGKSIWRDRAATAFGWFYGENHLGLPLCIPSVGSCCDGLSRDRVNRNQGAESTLAYLLSVVEMLEAGLISLERSPNLVHNQSI
jgi:hypothetical protein